MKKIFIIFVCLLSILILASVIAILCSKKTYSTIAMENDTDVLYMLPITSTHIDNKVFELSVPEKFIGNVAYSIKMNEDNNSYIIVFYHINSVMSYNPSEKNYVFGCLGTISWRDEVFSTDSYKEDGTIDWELDSSNGPFSYMILKKSRNESGVYIYVEPTDVQCSNELYDDYSIYEDELYDLIAGGKFILKCNMP